MVIEHLVEVLIGLRIHEGLKDAPAEVPVHQVRPLGKVLLDDHLVNEAALYQALRGELSVVWQISCLHLRLQQCDTSFRK